MFVLTDWKRTNTFVLCPMVLPVFLQRHSMHYCFGSYGGKNWVCCLHDLLRCSDVVRLASRGALGLEQHRMAGNRSG